jgi:hypothetical protein
LGVAVPALYGSSALIIDFAEPQIPPGAGPDSIPQFNGITPKGTVLGGQYSTVGVTFSVTNGVNYISNTAFMGPFAGAPGGNFLTVNTMPVGSTPNAVLTMTFTGVISTYPGAGITFFLADTNVSPDPRVVVRSYDASNNFIEEVQLHQPFGNLGFTHGQVHRVEFIDAGGDGFILGNLVLSLLVGP